jgi:hypothetical protein
LGGIGKGDVQMLLESTRTNQRTEGTKHNTKDTYMQDDGLYTVKGGGQGGDGRLRNTNGRRPVQGGGGKRCRCEYDNSTPSACVVGAGGEGLNPV